MIKKLTITTIVCVTLIASADVMAESQAELDAACEVTREEAYVSVRKKMVADCIKKGKESKQKCEQEYGNYNGPVYGRNTPFYDSPACEKAFKNKQKGTKR